MPRPKYPLQPLLEHRSRKVDAATAELADAIRAHDAAETARACAEQARDGAEAEARAIQDAEAGRLARGELRAVDLARGQAWESATRGAIERLADAADEAGRKAERAEDAEEGARAALAGAMAQRDVVARDRTRFEAAATRAEQARDEEAAEEASARRRSRG